MNLQSEIEYFTELRLIDKARLLNMFLHELAEEGRSTYGPGSEQVTDTAHLRFVNELVHRLTRVIEQLMAEDAARPPDDIVLRMLLSTRADNSKPYLLSAGSAIVTMICCIWPGV